jgi:hypothetical protein
MNTTSEIFLSVLDEVSNQCEIDQKNKELVERLKVLIGKIFPRDSGHRSASLSSIRPVENPINSAEEALVSRLKMSVFKIGYYMREDNPR